MPVPSEKAPFGSYPGSTVEVITTEISADGGPDYPRLLVPVELNLTPYEVRGGEKRYFDVQRPLRKIANVAPVFVLQLVREPSRTWRWPLEFSLDIYRINRLEQERSGSDVNFDLRLTFLICEYTPTPIQGQEIRGRESFDRVYTQNYFTIYESRWVKEILPRLAHLEYFIMEIPKGKMPEDQKVVQDAWGLLKEAEAALDKWNTVTLFEKCRSISKTLDNAIEKSSLPPFTKEKWNRALKAFAYFASLGVHGEMPVLSEQYRGGEIRRPDAEFLLFTTRFLLKYAGEILTGNC